MIKMKDHIHKAFNDSSSALIQAVMYKKTGEGGTKKGAANEFNIISGSIPEYIRTYMAHASNVCAFGIVLMAALKLLPP